MTALAVTLKNWFFTRNSMILNANILLFIILFNTLPFEPKVVTGISILVFCCDSLVNRSDSRQHYCFADPDACRLLGRV